jgi:putative peptidoglycan lipid II flippase
MNAGRGSETGPKEPAGVAAEERGAASEVGGTGAARVALGILVSRITGLIRERAIAHYFGNSAVADAFRAAIRIPNLLNNLLGEGVLSAAFVTVYAKLRAQGRDEEANEVANAVFGMLALVSAMGVLAGVALTPFLIDVIAPGFSGDKRDLTIRLVRILFPSTGLLALSAWCLGILNSHRRFLLSYLAPVALNATMIAALVTLGYAKQMELAIYLAWAAVAGSVLQLLVQVPRVMELLGRFRPSLDTHLPQMRVVARNFVPVFLSRGVVQISSYIDSLIASLLPTGAVAALGYAQTISLLPISLFSMSVSAAELPALSSATGSTEQVAEVLRVRLTAGLRRIAFLVVPSAVAFLLLGDIIAGALYQSGRFHRADSVYVWGVLAGSSVGLLASALGRLYSSAYYALLDTRTPLKYAAVRVAITTAAGVVAALFLPDALNLDRKWGVAGLTASAGLAGWVEFYLLRRGLARYIGLVSVPAKLMLKLWSVALIAAAAAYGIKRAVGTNHPLPLAVVALGVYGAVYWVGTLMAGVEEAREMGAQLLRRLPGRFMRQ